MGYPADLNTPPTVLTFALPRLPPGFIRHMENEPEWSYSAQHIDMMACLYDAAKKCWRLGIVTVLQVIWKWRLEFHERKPLVATQRFTDILQLRLRQGFRQLEAACTDIDSSRLARRAMHVVVAALNAYHATAPTPLIANTAYYVLFFDGGSRGNPGAGGSGSVIVKVDTDTGRAYPCWIASMAYGRKSTTNNLVEYRGLLHGLQQAAKGRLQPLHVVGDSQLIIKQQDGRRPSKTPHLLRLYLQCRALADECDVHTWTHHYREFNKTADAVANLVMDSKSSRQLLLDCGGAPHGAWNQALTHARRDLSEWQTSIPDLADRARHR